MLNLEKSKRYGLILGISDSGVFSSSKWLLGRTYLHGILKINFCSSYSKVNSSLFSDGLIASNCVSPFKRAILLNNILFSLARD